jgi:hypothetical protein
MKGFPLWVVVADLHEQKTAAHVVKGELAAVEHAPEWMPRPRLEG